MLSSILYTTLLSAGIASANMEVRRANSAQHAHMVEAERSLDEMLDTSLEARAAPVDYTSGPCPADNPHWLPRNAETWWKVDSSQQDHARFHAYLSMAAYGDPNECEATWPGEWKLLQQFSAPGKPWGQDGYVAEVPSMDKVILVFKGNQAGLDGLDLTPTDISDIVPTCKGCKVAKGVKTLYLAAKKATNDFKVYEDAIHTSGLKASVTGHGVGGGVAALACMEYGKQGKNLTHYCHNQGMPRLFNYAAMKAYDRMFMMESGQSLVSRNDYLINAVPAGPFCHLGQKAHITGDLTQWWTNCYGWNENTTCLGAANNKADHTYYFTPIGKCGSKNKGF